MKWGNELMIAIAKIQQAPQSKRAQMIAEAREAYREVQWSSPALRNWAIWAFKEGIK